MAGNLPATAASRAVLALLDAEPELAGGIPPDELPLARRLTMARRLDLPVGLWHPPDPHALGADPFALLVVEGLMTRTVALADRTSAQLCGPGEVLSVWSEPDSLVPALIEWHPNVPTTVAVLDDRILTAARRWPSLFRCLQERVAAQSQRLAVHVAIAQLPRVETRIMAMLWHLADRFGRVTPTGVVLPLRLTHEALGHLIGAQRPTVTLALRELAERGAVHRGEDGVWALREGSQIALAPDPDSLSAVPAIVETPFAPAPRPGSEPPAERISGPERDDLAQLRERVGVIRDALPEQDRRVRRLLDEAMMAKERSARLRRQLSAERQARLRP